MTTAQQMLIGLAIIAIGGLKTWLHMGTVPVLALPLCSGKTVLVTASHSNWFEQAHCWGCYALLAGVLVTLHAVLKQIQKRRSVASIVD